MPIDLSLGELEALVAKAARGAGLGWGLAAEAGGAVRVLSTAGGPGADLAAALLANYDKVQPPRLVTGHWVSDAAICPITLGAAFGDFRVGATAIGVAYPALLAGALPRFESGALLSWAGGEIHFDGKGLRLDGDIGAASVDQVRLTPECPIAFDAVKRTRATVSKETYGTLDRLARKTYAPATEASRLAGAGAGLTDND